jgi:NAD(P)-dependent dehydrogenase (short-subunit alcohol dehydrogenase family)
LSSTTPPSDKPRFTDKVAFVTGATSGIRATARAFAREGARVVVADVAAEGNEETARLSTSADAADGIRINAICPGIIDTPMMSRFTGDSDEDRAGVIAQEPVGRMGRPEPLG